jgi:hypothetical protein
MAALNDQVRTGNMLAADSDAGQPNRDTHTDRIIMTICDMSFRQAAKWHEMPVFLYTYRLPSANNPE